MRSPLILVFALGSMAFMVYTLDVHPQKIPWWEVSLIVGVGIFAATHSANNFFVEPFSQGDAKVAILIGVAGGLVAVVAALSIGRGLQLFDYSNETPLILRCLRDYAFSAITFGILTSLLLKF